MPRTTLWLSRSLRLSTVALALVVFTAPSSRPILVIDVAGQPFMALPSLDGSTIFVSVQTSGTHKNEIAVFHRVGDAYTNGRTIQVDGTPLGLALTPDAATLLAADGDRYLAISAEAAQRDAAPSTTFVIGASEPGAVMRADPQSESFVSALRPRVTMRPN